MWISQSVHQHVAMEASGLPVERVLVEGCGTPIILPYADNLNVAGTDRVQVQAVKDVIVGRLRDLGFRVHEETDACSAAQSLGFMIDGERGVIHPIADRWDRIMKAFNWLSCRPKIEGRALERLLGHAIHLLRRELRVMLLTTATIVDKSCGPQQRRRLDGVRMF